jgi:ATP-dependent exoDNAse (exonuclease V) beta subunit
LDEHAESGVVEFENDVKVRLTVDRSPQGLWSAASAPVEESEENLIDLSQPFTELFPLLSEVAPEQGQVLRRFSVTQLINFQRCARQYYFDRMLKTPGTEERRVWNDAEAPEPPANLTATLKGAVIHRFCETFHEGDDAKARLQSSFNDVVAQRLSELAGRPFKIDPDQAVADLMPLAENYLQSEVFQRVSEASRVNAADNESAIRHPQSEPGLWSELRFRLRRPLGILTGTIDKLLVTPSVTGEGFDVEIIDFKTNKFRPTATLGVKPTQTAAMAPQSSSSHLGEVKQKPGQALFNFDAIEEKMAAELTTTDVVSVQPAPSIMDQAEAIARDYQLQMQSYALALRELLGLKINTLCATLHFIDPNVEISLPAAFLDQETCAQAIDEAMLSISTLDGTLAAELFPPLPTSHCRICNFLELCPAGRDWLNSR